MCLSKLFTKDALDKFLLLKKEMFESKESTQYNPAKGY